MSDELGQNSAEVVASEEENVIVENPQEGADSPDSLEKNVSRDGADIASVENINNENSSVDAETKAAETVKPVVKQDEEVQAQDEKSTEAKQVSAEQQAKDFSVEVAGLLARAEERQKENPDLKWYIIMCQSGFEKRATLSLQEGIRKSTVANLFGEILIPAESVVELVRGRKKSSERKFFPGYMLVQMVVNNETWHVVKNANRVTGFVGNVQNPPPVPPAEFERITKQMTDGGAHIKPKFRFKEGDNVKVIDGPFSNFTGNVEEVNPQKNKLRVLVSIFGRATPVELDYIQVKKV